MPRRRRCCASWCPEEGAGASVSEHLALLHHAWLFWRDGTRTAVLSRDEARALARDARRAPRGGAGGARYIQFPERLFWAELVPGAPHEPLDGFFVHEPGASELAVLGGLRLPPGAGGIQRRLGAGASRPGVASSHAMAVPLFAPVMAGGAEAGLFSLVGEDELLELAARARAASKEG